METFIQNLIQFFITPIGGLFFILLYTLWVFFLLPGSFLSMLGGLIYGTYLGSLLVLIGAFFGAQFTFILGRKFLRSWIKTRIDKFPKIQLIEKSISKEGLKLVFLSRLSPAFPFGLLNLAYGISQVNYKDFSIGLIGIVPGTILYCALGDFAGEISRFNEVSSSKDDIISLAFSLVGIVSTILVILLVSRAVTKALKQSESIY